MYSTLKSWVSSPRSSSPSQKELCEACGVKSKFVENGHRHPYCSRTCARNMQTQMGQYSQCTLYGCRAQGDPASGGFCSEKHARDAVRSGQVRPCAQCRMLPRTIDRLCARCDEENNQTEPSLHALHTQDVTFRSVEAEFKRSWKGEKSVSVAKILRISQPRTNRNKYEDHRKRMLPLAALQEVITFHSSQCICDLGVNETVLCGWKSCGICNIVKSCFNTLAFGVTHYPGRYGDGIYSYRNPAKADLYATSSTSSPFRVMLACNVLIGTGSQNILVSTSKEVLSCDDGERVFVKNADAILPSYIILYTM